MSAACQQQRPTQHNDAAVTCQATEIGSDARSMNTCTTPADTNASAVITMPSDMRNRVLQEPRQRVMQGYSTCKRASPTARTMKASGGMQGTQAQERRPYQLKRGDEYAHQHVLQRAHYICQHEGAAK